MSGILDKTVVVCHSSWPEEKILFWHAYHKQHCPNVKMVQAIKPGSGTKKIEHEDFRSMVLDPRILFMCVDFFWINWIETKYEYFLFMEHDCFMIRPAISECVSYMMARNLECLHPPYQDKSEHRKQKYYPNVNKAYGIPVEKIKWCLPNAVFMSRAGLRKYCEKVIPFAGSEVTVPNIFMGNGGAENPYISNLTNRSGILREYEWVDAKNWADQRFYHSVKDYGKVVDFTGFGKEYDRKILGAW